MHAPSSIASRTSAGSVGYRRGVVTGDLAGIVPDAAVYSAGLSRGRRSPGAGTWSGLVSEMRLLERGPNTIKSKQRLRAELNRIRRDGLAINDEELAAELLAVAVGVRDEAREVVAALAIAAPVSMISLADLVGELSPHLIATADGISARLGYRRADERVAGDEGCPEMAPAGG